MNSRPPLKPLHRDESLSQAKLKTLERLFTDALTRSLIPGQEHSLKVRSDGTMMDGHHRIFVLRLRAVALDELPREPWFAPEP